MRNDSFATTERTGNGNGATKDRWEKGVQHTLSDEERTVGRFLLSGGTRNSHRPRLHHGVSSLLAVKFDLDDLFIDSIAALGRDLGDSSARTRREQDSVGRDERVLVDRAPDVAARDMVANLHGGGEIPLLLAVESGDGNTTRNVDALCDGGDVLEGSLNTIVNVVQQTGAELNGQRLAGTQDGVTDLDTSCMILSSVPRLQPRLLKEVNPPVSS